VIRVPSDITSQDVEVVLQEIVANPGQALLLPIKIARSAPFGVSTLLLLAISKWQRTNSGDARLLVPKDVSTSADSRTRLAGTLHGMAGFWFADQVVTDELNFRHQALESVAPYVSAMSAQKFVDTIRGPHVLLCCFQPAKNEFLRALYAHPRRGSRDSNGKEDVTIRNEGEILDLLKDVFGVVALSMSDGQLAAVSSAVFQLFKNADVHTVTDENGHSYKKSMRGLMLRRVSVKETAEIEDYSGSDRKLTAFLIRNSTGNATGSFVEISVFDTGPGLAARWLSRERNEPTAIEQVSFEDELEATKKCFELHMTTQGSGRHGDGLAIALRALVQLGAFMSLRTGRVSLFQDFSNAKTQSKFSPEHRFPKRSQLVATGGTSYTLCIPVR
jgi:hypothetical protein